MVSCSKSSALLEGAFRRAFFYSGQSRLQFILLAVVLHAALLSSLPASAPIDREHRQAISIHLERQQPAKTVNSASVFASDATQVLVPVKAKQKALIAPPDLPRAIAATPSETPRNEIAAALPQAAPASAGPVVGLALPHAGMIEGHRRLWSVQQSATIPDDQVRFREQRQREALLAIQAGQLADREKFEAQLMRELNSVQVISPCRVIVPSAKPIHMQCENDVDANAVRAVLNKMGNAPAVQTDTAPFIVDLAPSQSGVAQTASHRSSAEPMHNE